MLDPETEAYDLAGLDFVVVDDSMFMLKLMEAMLTALGAESIRCIDEPTQVFAQLEQQPAHILITDIMMRPIDGIELTRTVRSWGGDVVPFTPIFVVSGLTDQENVMRAADAGVHEVLAKPLSPRRLYERIHRTIEHPVDFVKSNAYFGPDRRSGRAAKPAVERRRANPDDVVYL